LTNVYVRPAVAFVPNSVCCAAVSLPQVRNLIRSGPAGAPGAAPIVIFPDADGEGLATGAAVLAGPEALAVAGVDVAGGLAVVEADEQAATARAVTAATATRSGTDQPTHPLDTRGR
jgi:hypothetical protein